MAPATDQVLPDRQLRGRQPAARSRTSDRCRPTRDRTNSLNSGHRACQGCGEALGARYALDAVMRATGNQMVAVNATGCLEVFSTPYPETSWQIPVAALAVRQRAGRRHRGRRGAARRRAGPTSGSSARAATAARSTSGSACLSGMFERNDDVLFICYDNGGYMNTGVQRSGATPPAAATTTTPAVGPEPGNAFGQGKSLPLIAMAHEIPYVATATVADLRDLESKVDAGDGVPRRPLPARAGAVPAGLADRRRARPSGSPGWPPRPASSRSSRPSDGEVTACRRIRQAASGRGLPAAAGPYAHLFGDHAARGRHRPDPGRGGPQHPPLRPARPAGEEMPMMRHTPVRDHAGRRLQPGQQDRLVAHRAAGVRRPAAAVQRRLPGRREHPAVAVPRRGGRLRGGLAADHGGQPVPRHHGPGLLPPVRDRLQPRDPRRGGRHQLGRAVPRRRGDPAGLDGSGRRRRRPASGCWSSAPVRPGCPRRTTSPCSATQVTVRDAGAEAGGMMRYGIPAYRLPRDVVDAEIERIVDMGVRLELGTAGHRPRAGACATAASTRCSSAVGAHIGKRADIPAGDSARILDAVSVLRGMAERRAAAARPPGRRVRRRQHRDGRRPHRPAARRHRRGGGLPAHPRPDARPRHRGRGGRSRRACGCGGCPPSRTPTTARVRVEKMRLDETGFPQPTGEFEELTADAVVLALGQDVDLSLVDGRARRRRSPTASSRSART